MGKIADTTRSWAIGQEQRRQMLAFDAELEEMHGKVRRLEAKVLDLEKKTEPLEQENKRLKQRLEEEAAKVARAEKLAEFKNDKGAQRETGTIDVLKMDEIKEQMLRVLNKHPRAPTPDIASSFDLTVDGAKFHLEAMRKVKMVERGWDDEEIWWLEQNGREYLHKKGWLK